MTETLVVPILLAAVAGLTSAGVWAYLTARRSGSGRVDTSDAATVFAAVGEHLKRIDADNQGLREERTALRSEVDGLRRQLRDAEIDCQRQIAEVRADCQRQIDELNADVRTLRGGR